jgi:hypothetical protein
MVSEIPKGFYQGWVMGQEFVDIDRLAVHVGEDMG